MTSFARQIAEAMEAWFDDNLADQVVLNGKTVCAHIEANRRQEEQDKYQQYIDIQVRRSDYPVIDYQSDRLEAAGGTWRWPQMICGDNWTLTVRFVRHQRHRMRS